MMLALFVCYASCKIFWNWASSSGSNKSGEDDTVTSDRNFDIKYSKNDNDMNYSTTADDKGWKVELRYPSGDSGQMYQVLGTNEGVLKQDNLPLTVTTEFNQSLGENFMYIIFKVKNTGTSESTFDLGTFANIMIRGDQNSAVTPLSGLKGFTMMGSKDGVSKDAITLLAGGLLDVTDVDYLWYGEHSDDNIHIGKNLENLEPIDGKNSVFELGWTSKTIQPGKIQSFNVLLAMGKTIRSPPTVVSSQENPVCKLGTKCEIHVQYKSSNQDVTLKLYYKIEGDSSEFKEVNSFTTGTEKSSQDYTIEFDGGSEPKEYKVIFYAQDTETTLKSDEYTVTVKVQQKSLEEEEEEKKKKERLKLIGIIAGSVAGGLVLIGAITYFLLGPAKRRKNEEEEEKPENYIDDVQTTNQIAKEIANINNIFTVSVEDASDEDAPEFVTEDTIKF